MPGPAETVSRLPADPTPAPAPRGLLARALACLDVLHEERDELPLAAREALVARAAALMDALDAGHAPAG